MGWTSSLVTISLAVDFIGAAQVGQWLVIESDVIKTGSTICFAQSLIKADEVVIARGQRDVPRGAEEGSRRSVTGVRRANSISPVMPGPCAGHPRLGFTQERRGWPGQARP